MAEGRAAFIDFYDREHLHVERSVMRCGASRQAAEEAVQDAFIDVWVLTALGTWPDIADPPGWIRTVALRKYRRPAGPRRLPATLPGP
jgi:DNA-directed RNA polymerase specialized sigma24 family protein